MTKIEKQLISKVRSLLEQLKPETPTIISLSGFMYLFINLLTFQDAILRTQTCTVWGHSLKHCWERDSKGSFIYFSCQA